MANTTLQLKKSGITGNVPSSLEFGELALNYADGKLYYKNADDVITFISSGSGGGDSFTTINANSSLIIATSNTDTLSFAAGNNITITACTTTKTITINSQDADIDQFARNTANGAVSLAQDAYNFANTISGGAAIDNVARTSAQAALTLAQAAYDQANVTIGVDAWQNTQITSVNQYVQAAYNTANTKANLFGYTANTLLVANATGYVSNSGLFFTSSNNTLIVPGSIVGTQANTTITANGFVTTFDTTGAASFPGIVYIANTNISAFANTISANTIYTQGVDAWQNNEIVSVNQFAQAAFNQANTGGGGITIITGGQYVDYGWILQTPAPVLFDYGTI